MAKANGILGSLVAAIKRAVPSEVESILAADPQLATATVPSHPAEGDPEGTTLLHWAMPGDGRELRDEHVEVARLLLKYGADPNVVGNGPNHGRCAPLSLAAWGNHVPLIELLLEHGADPDGSSKDRSPILTAAEHDHIAAVETLVEAGATHMLYELVLAGLEPKVRRYLDEHPAAAIDLLHGDIPPLHAALLTQAGAKLIPLLLERGADPERCDGAGRTALHAAIDQERVRAAEILRTIGDLDIFAAAGLGEESRVAELLASDPKLARESQADGTTALFYAILAGNVSIASRLLDARSDASPRSTRHWACIAPLHLAIMRKQMSLVDLLLSRGSDPDSHSSARSYSPTPLHIAARWGEHEYIVRLLEAGADLFAGGPVSQGTGHSVIGWVAFSGQVDTLRLLIDYGLDVRDTRCGAVIHLAAAKGHTVLVDLLLRYGVDPGGLDREGRTPLECAIEQGQIETVELLQQRRTL